MEEVSVPRWSNDLLTLSHTIRTASSLEDAMAAALRFLEPDRNEWPQRLQVLEQLRSNGYPIPQDDNDDDLDGDVDPDFMARIASAIYAPPVQKGKVLVAVAAQEEEEDKVAPMDLDEDTDPDGLGSLLEGLVHTTGSFKKEILAYIEAHPDTVLQETLEYVTEKAFDLNDLPLACENVEPILSNLIQLARKRLKPACDRAQAAEADPGNDDSQVNAAFMNKLRAQCSPIAPPAMENPVLARFVTIHWNARIDANRRTFQALFVYSDLIAYFGVHSTRDGVIASALPMGPKTSTLRKIKDSALLRTACGIHDLVIKERMYKLRHLCPDTPTLETLSKHHAAIAAYLAQHEDERAWWQQGEAPPQSIPDPDHPGTTYVDPAWFLGDNQ